MSYNRGDTIVIVGKLFYAVHCIYNRVPRASNISFGFWKFFEIALDDTLKTFLIMTIIDG